MSLNPQPIPPVPEDTSKVAQAAFPKGNLYLRLRDELGVFYTDCDFDNLYSVYGQPGYSPWRLAMVLVMQFLENLSDRQAAEAVRGRIDWKYALSLDLTDSGFDFTILIEWSERLITEVGEQELLNKMLEKFQEKGLVCGKGKQRTDSTHILAKVRELTRLESLIETVRYALNTLAEVAPDWLKANLQSEWCDRYSKRTENTRKPA